MGHRGRARTVKFIQRKFDVPNLEQKDQDYISKYSVCPELEPMFFKPFYTPLIRSKQPWERLSLAFLGLKKFTTAENKYFSTVVGEFSKLSSRLHLLLKKPTQLVLFLIYRSYSRHSVLLWRLIAFEEACSKLRSSKPSQNICKTRITTYNPADNGQCERLNRIIWKTIILRLK